MRAFQAQVAGSFPAFRSKYQSMQKRYPNYPCIDSALVETRKQFGVPIAQHSITEEMREIASRFDVQSAIKEAEQMRSRCKNLVL